MANDIDELKRRIGALERALHEAHIDASLAVDYQWNDPAGSISKVGRALERLLGDIVRRETGSAPQGLTIEQLRSRVQEAVPDIPSTVRRHMDHVRLLRNIGSHANTGRITPEDARVALLAFAIIAEWYLERYVAPQEVEHGLGEGGTPESAHSPKEPGGEPLIRRRRNRGGGAALRRFLAVISASALVAFIAFALCFIWLNRTLPNVTLRSPLISTEASSVPAMLGEGGGTVDEAALAAAEETYSTELAAEPNNVEFLNNRGYVRLKRGDRDGAIVDLSACVAAMPRNARCHYSLALAHAGGGDKALALAALQIAVGLDATLGQEAGADIEFELLADENVFREMVGAAEIDFTHEVDIPHGIKLRSAPISRDEVRLVQESAGIADPSGTVVCGLSSGRKVHLQARSGDWYLVKTTCMMKDVTGYVSARYGGKDTLRELR